MPLCVAKAVAALVKLLILMISGPSDAAHCLGCARSATLAGRVVAISELLGQTTGVLQQYQQQKRLSSIPRQKLSALKAPNLCKLTTHTNDFCRPDSDVFLVSHVIDEAISISSKQTQECCSEYHALCR